jgi:hypothetical protein
MHKILIALLVTSCAHYKELSTEYDVKNSSKASLSDVAYTSYLKSCSENSKLSFEQCRKKAKAHADELVQILKQ